MHLFNVETEKLEYVVTPTADQKFAILSHTWGDDELSYHDVATGADFKSKAGYYKLERTCAQAKKDGLKYVWIDTCCINKDSSAELTEAINSMFEWYRTAEICYAFLSDVTAEGVVGESEPHIPSDACKERSDGSSDEDNENEDTPPGSPDSSDIDDGNSDHSSHAFTKSRWFTRGWTLQELIAPRSLRFYDSTWSLIGTRDDLSSVVSARTGIPSSVLRSPYRRIEIRQKVHFRADRYSVAQRMSWAAGRECSREEDRAYSLLGLFHVNMPLLYGERSAAFRRLQEEIIKRSTDHSILLWTGGEQRDRHSILAATPDDFGPACRRIMRYRERGTSSFELTNAGLKIKLPICRHPKEQKYFAMLDCRFEDDYTGQLGLVIAKHKGSTFNHDSIYGFYRDKEVGDEPRFVSVDSECYDHEVCQPIILSKETGRRIVRMLQSEGSRILFPQFNSRSPIFKIEKRFPEQYWNGQTGVITFPGISTSRDRAIAKSWGYVVFSVFGSHATTVRFVLAFGILGRRNATVHTYLSRIQNATLYMFLTRAEDLGDKSNIRDRLFADENQRGCLQIDLDDDHLLKIEANTEGRVDRRNDRILVINSTVEKKGDLSGNSSAPPISLPQPELDQDAMPDELDNEYWFSNSYLEREPDEPYYFDMISTIKKASGSLRIG